MRQAVGPVGFISQQLWVTVVMPSMLKKPPPAPSDLWETQLLKRYRTGRRHTDEQKDTVWLWKDKLGASGSVSQPVLSTIPPMLGIRVLLLYLSSREWEGLGGVLCPASELGILELCP